MCLNGHYLRDSEDRVDVCLSLLDQFDRSTLARAKSNVVSGFGKLRWLSIPVSLFPIERDLHSEM